jgi:hypothetical protein
MVRAQEIVRADGEIVRRKPQVGDMRWCGGRWTRWSGRRWAAAAYSLHREQLRDRTRFDARPPIDQELRDRAMALAVEDQVAVSGATVVHEGPHGVVLAYRRRVSHFFHGVLTILTGGVWGFVWLAMVLSKREDRVRLEADVWGNVWARPVARG